MSDGSSARRCGKARWSGRAGKMVPLMAILAVVVVVVVLTVGARHWQPAVDLLSGRKTVDRILGDVGIAAEERLQPYFARAGVAYPPSQVAILVFKREMRLELCAKGDGGWRAIKTYPLVAASGRLGPKLAASDQQVPEGIYRVVALDPNSKYYLSMEIDYPNKFDRDRAWEDKRDSIGKGIAIHGGSPSVGCVVLADEAMEELFSVVGRLWPTEAKVAISPVDLRRVPAPKKNKTDPAWLPRLHDALAAELANYK